MLNKEMKMDEIGQRLRDSADACVSAYEAWAAAKKDVEIREGLQEAVHELRKISARLEIEMAVSEREQMAQRPIPVPPHRASRRREPGSDDSTELPGFITDGGSDEGQSRPPKMRSGGSNGPRRSGSRRPQGSQDNGNRE
jgi:hypothetical protein